jgi:hypothetical protein
MPQVSADKAPKMGVPESGIAGLGLRRRQSIPAFDNLDEEATLKQQYAITRG